MAFPAVFLRLMHPPHSSPAAWADALPVLRRRWPKLPSTSRKTASAGIWPAEKCHSHTPRFLSTACPEADWRLPFEAGPHDPLHHLLLRARAHTHTHTHTPTHTRTPTPTHTRTHCRQLQTRKERVKGVRVGVKVRSMHWPPGFPCTRKCWLFRPWRHDRFRPSAGSLNWHVSNVRPLAVA